MSGVTAGVISIDSDRTVQLVNSSAVALLDSGGGDPVGRPLAVLSAELDALLESDTREAVIQVAAEREPRTLAVKLPSDAAGQRPEERRIGNECVSTGRSRGAP